MRSVLPNAIKSLKEHLNSPCNAKKSSFEAVNRTHLNYLKYMKILQHCVEKRAENHGHLIHGRIITNGFGTNLHLSTKLIIFYAKIGHTDSARKVFDRIPERSIVSWTAQISGYTQNGSYQDALLVFLEMHRAAGVRANQFTYGSVLRACTALRCLEGGLQIQGCIQKGRFFGNLFVQSALVDFHSKCGKMEDACYLFGMMSERDVVSWNAMIGGCALQGRLDDSFHMFRSMMQEGVTPDHFTLGSVLKASGSAISLMKVCQIHGFVLQLGYGAHSALTGSLIGAYVKCENIKTAYHLYQSMPKKDIISYTTLMTGCAHNSDYNREALSLFKEIQLMRVEVDDIILCSVLNVCANISSLSTGRQIHAFALKYKLSYDVAVGNALIDMYAKSGQIEDANRAFTEMGEKNVISWTSLITGYGKHGCGHKAITLYKQMEDEGFKPNDVTFLSLLFACSHSGLTGEGWECFNLMIDKYNIMPRVEHFSCIIDLLARRGHLEEAYDMLCKMNTKPDASLWGSILGACKIYGNISLGEVASSHLLNMDPESSANYVAAGSLYAEAGAWDHAWKLRNLMDERNLKKASGYSLIDCTKAKVALLQPS